MVKNYQKKTNDQILRKFSDRWTDIQTDKSDFIGCCPTNVEHPKKTPRKSLTLGFDADEIITSTSIRFDLSSDDRILMHDKTSNTDEYVPEEAVPLKFGQCTKMFSILFEYVKKKLSPMYYWDGSKRFLKVKKGNVSVNNTESLILLTEYDIVLELIHHVKSGPKQNRKN